MTCERPALSQKTLGLGVALLTVLVAAAPATVVIIPPPLSQLAGTYVGSVGGTTLQRLVLDEEGQGYLVDVWWDAKGNHSEIYKVRLRQRTGFRVELTLEPVAAKQLRQPVARGDADSFLIRLKFPETDRYRSRSITLFHEHTWQSMLDYARGLSAPR